jgi:HSP20 family protein
MTLIPWKQKRTENGGQLAQASNFRTEMDRLFDSFFVGGLPAWSERAWPSFAGWEPPVDVEETEKEVFVRAEVPGMKADDIDLSIHDNTLVISGEKKETEERKEGGYVYQERRYGSFRRQVSLPSAVDAETVSAEYKDGVLHVTLQKSQEALPKKIKVTAK